MRRASSWLALALLLAACSPEDAAVCDPGTVDLCFDGSPEAAAVGACHPGRRTCKDDGSGYGPCIRQVLPAVERCDTPDVDESCDGEPRCTGKLRWGERFGDERNQSVDGVAAYGAQGALVRGRLDGVVDFGGAVLPASGQPGPFLAAFDGGGAVTWARLLGAKEGTTTLSSAFADAEGNVIAAGWFEGTTDLGDGPVASQGGADGFLFSLDAQGALRWKTILGGPGDQRAWVGPPDARGDLVVSAVWSGHLDFGGASLDSAFADPLKPDLTVFRCDARGDVRWATSLSGDVQPFLSLGIVTPVRAVAGEDGRVFVATAGGPLVTLDGYDFASTSGVAATWVIELDPGGALGWSARLDGQGHRLPADIGAAPGGDVVVATALTFSTGGLVNNVDTLAIARFGPEGEPGWQSRIFSLDSGGGGVAVDAAGNVILTAHAPFGAVNFGMETLPVNGQFLAKVSPRGDLLWLVDLGAGLIDARVAADALGGARVAGDLQGVLQVGGELLQSAAPETYDIALAAAAP